jgi:hypothetical protein
MHDSLQFVTLDEFAECFDGVTKELYRKLWETMPDDKDIPPRGEWPEPDSSDRVARSLKKHWGKFTPEEQALINKIAAQNE